MLDADVIIRGKRGVFDLFGWLNKQPHEHFELASITIAELWHGVERASGKQRSAREAYLQTVVSLLPVIPYTEQTGYIHARIWADLEKRGLMIGEYDIVVGATALERGSSVATFNQKHYQSIKGLGVIMPA
jgi:predicted nucleic acid-binding protein